MKQLVRALAIEAARLRVELRNWDVASAEWLGVVSVRLNQLVEAVTTISQVAKPAGPASASGCRVGVEVDPARIAAVPVTS